MLLGTTCSLRVFVRGEVLHYVRGWWRRRHYLVEVLHDLLDGRDGLANPGHRPLGDPVRALYLGPSQGHVVQLGLHLRALPTVVLLRRSLERDVDLRRLLRLHSLEQRAQLVHGNMRLDRYIPRGDLVRSRPVYRF